MTIVITVDSERPGRDLSLVTAVTIGMLNINESSEESQNTNGSVQGLHPRNEYYKLPVVVDASTKGIALITSDGKTDGTLQEMVWRYSQLTHSLVFYSLFYTFPNIYNNMNSTKL